VVDECEYGNSLNLEDILELPQGLIDRMLAGFIDDSVGGHAFFPQPWLWCQMCGSSISLIRCRMKVGGTYGTVIAYQKVGAKAGKKKRRREN
jgi:hypothetical protein